MPGPYFSDRFAEVADIAADNGRFYVVEGGEAGSGLRRIALVAEDGTMLDERFGGAPFFSCAAAVPGNPREVYYSSCYGLIGRYDFDPQTGKNRLTHLLKLDAPLFPGFAAFPHYKPVVRKGQVYLVLCGTGCSGAYIVRPDLTDGRARAGRAVRLQAVGRLDEGNRARADRQSRGASRHRPAFETGQRLHLVRHQRQRAARSRGVPVCRIRAEARRCVPRRRVQSRLRPLLRLEPHLRRQELDRIRLPERRLRDAVERRAGARRAGVGHDASRALVRDDARGSARHLAAALRLGLQAPRWKRCQEPFVPSTRRAVPANGSCRWKRCQEPFVRSTRRAVPAKGS